MHQKVKLNNLRRSPIIHEIIQRLRIIIRLRLRVFLLQEFLNVISPLHYYKLWN